MAGIVYAVSYSRYGNLIHELMKRPHTLLIDCRKTAYSGMQEWCGDDLKARYKEAYRQAGLYLGNVNYNKDEAPIAIANIHDGIRGLQMYLSEGFDLILMCGCTNYDHCHLKVIVEALREATPLVDVFIPGYTEIPGMFAAFSGYQPFPWLMVHPDKLIQADVEPKTIENRDWNTAFRGVILLHASKTIDKEVFHKGNLQNERISRRYADTLKRIIPQNIKEYPLGAIVGMGILTDVITESDDPWFRGDYGMVLEQIHPITPIPYRGDKLIFYVPQEILNDKEGVA